MGKVKDQLLDDNLPTGWEDHLEEIMTEREKVLEDQVRLLKKLQKEVQIYTDFTKNRGIEDDYLIFRKIWVSQYGPNGEHHPLNEENK